MQLFETLKIQSKGPIAFIFLDDGHLVAETVNHCLSLGFGSVVLVGKRIHSESLLGKDQINLHFWVEDISDNQKISNLMNKVCGKLQEKWIFYCYNGEFFHFPFSGSRSVSDFAAFLDEERRPVASVLTLDIYPNAPLTDFFETDFSKLFMDNRGYFSRNKSITGAEDLRSIEIHGGLRWRQQEFIPPQRRKVNNSSFFKSTRGLKMNSNFEFNLPLYETHQSKWHNSPTAAVCSLRAAKYLANHKDALEKVETLVCPHSIEYQRLSSQLLNLGFIESGQWF